MSHDCQYKDISYSTNEVEQRYGSKVHILSNPSLSALLAKLSAVDSSMPLINIYIERLYSIFLHEVVNNIFPRKDKTIITKMDAELRGEFVDFSQPVVVVDLARAGTFPAHTCFDQLNLLLTPADIRQDHIYLNRKVDREGKVIGVDYAGSKIGGSQQGAMVLFPDPMGATGASLAHVIDIYKQSVEGKAKKYIAMHLIITPEYLTYMSKHHPDVEIFAIRLDRGLSSQDVLASIAGEQWDREQGLNEFQYIIPGAGGVGELLNNTTN